MRHALRKVLTKTQQAEVDIARQRDSEQSCPECAVRRNHIINSRISHFLSLWVTIKYRQANLDTNTVYDDLKGHTETGIIFLSNPVGQPEVKDNPSWKQMGYRMCCCYIAINRRVYGQRKTHYAEKEKPYKQPRTWQSTTAVSRRTEASLRRHRQGHTWWIFLSQAVHRSSAKTRKNKS